MYLLTSNSRVGTGTGCAGCRVVKGHAHTRTTLYKNRKRTQTNHCMALFVYSSYCVVTSLFLKPFCLPVNIHYITSVRADSSDLERCTFCGGHKSTPQIHTWICSVILIRFFSCLFLSLGHFLFRRICSQLEMVPSARSHEFLPQKCAEPLFPASE